MRAFAQRRGIALGRVGILGVLRVLCANLHRVSHAKLAKENAPYLLSSGVGRLLRSRRSLSGQSLIESCLVIAILCLVLFGGIQVSQLYMAEEVLDYAAFCGARARATGLNEFMVEKFIRVASIPVAGRLIQPSYESNPYSIIPETPNKVGGAWNVATRSKARGTQAEIETNAIPLYLNSRNWGEAQGYLNYELDYLDQWGEKNTSIPFIYVVSKIMTEFPNGMVEMRVRHLFPLNFPFHHAIPGLEGDVKVVEGEALIDNHYPLYLE